MYTLEILGFEDEADELQEKFVSTEKDTSQTIVWARLTAEQLPDFSMIQATTQLLLED